MQGCAVELTKNCFPHYLLQRCAWALSFGTANSFCCSSTRINGRKLKLVRLRPIQRN